MDSATVPGPNDAARALRRKAKRGSIRLRLLLYGSFLTRATKAAGQTSDGFFFVRGRRERGQQAAFRVAKRHLMKDLGAVSVSREQRCSKVVYKLRGQGLMGSIQRQSA